MKLASYLAQVKPASFNTLRTVRQSDEVVFRTALKAYGEVKPLVRK